MEYIFSSWLCYSILPVVWLVNSLYNVLLVLWRCFVVSNSYHNQLARSYGLLSSQQAARSQWLRLPVMKQLDASPGGITVEQIRMKARVYYRPNVHKRLKKHGLKTRLSTKNGLKILWRRLLKGRSNLSTWRSTSATMKVDMWMEL